MPCRFPSACPDDEHRTDEGLPLMGARRLTARARSLKQQQVVHALLANSPSKNRAPARPTGFSSHSHRVAEKYWAFGHTSPTARAHKSSTARVRTRRPPHARPTHSTASAPKGRATAPLRCARGAHCALRCCLPIRMKCTGERGRVSTLTRLLLACLHIRDARSHGSTGLFRRRSYTMWPSWVTSEAVTPAGTCNRHRICSTTFGDYSVLRNAAEAWCTA